jgi:hypothetical protein
MDVSIKEKVRRFLQGAGGKATALILFTLIGVAVYRSVRDFSTSAGETANRRLYICAETSKSYEITLDPSTPCPAPSPYSGKNTGYPAELCYWTKDGSIKSEPTAVLLKMWTSTDWSSHEPTFCPDCGRLVVRHNPRPKPGDRPPPTQAEYEAKHVAQDTREGER